jgi:hypothetical protein
LANESTITSCGLSDVCPHLHTHPADSAAWHAAMGMLVVLRSLGNHHLGREQQTRFPFDSLIFLLTTVDKHRSLEVGMIGNEDMAGTPCILGMGISAVRALVQGGSGLRPG